MMDFDEIVVKESPGLCRCCLSEGCYKDLGSEYSWMSETEIYADMLLECFDISISQHPSGPNGSNRLICEVCITRLRDACNFKKQVLESEKRFVDMVGRGEFRPKEDLLKNEDYGEPSVSEDITVSALAVKGKRGRPKKSSTAVKPEKKAKVPKLEEKPTKSKAVAKGMKWPETASVVLTNKSLLTATNRNRLMKANAITVLESSTVVPFRWHNVKPRKYKGCESSSMRRRRNLQILFNSTTIIPFKWRGKYLCFYCSKDIAEYSALRKHTKSHGDCSTRDHSLKVLKGGQNMEIKIDVSDISCEICSEPFPTYDDIVTHLFIKHKLEYDKGVDMAIEEYRLVDLSCLACEEKFAYFGYLVSHVNNSHPKNCLICDKCEQKFNKKRDLFSHMKNYHREEIKHQSIGGLGATERRRKNLVILFNNTTVIPFKSGSQFGCFYCGEKYRDYKEFVKHTKSHGPCNVKHKSLVTQKYGSSIEVKLDISNVTCELCDEPFNSLDEIIPHLIAKHGLHYDQDVPMCLSSYRLVDLKCTECGKSFEYFRNLVMHVRKNHMEKLVPCEQCDKSFNKKSDLAAHCRIYHRRAGFQCVKCELCFRKNSLLRLHLMNTHGASESKCARILSRLKSRRNSYLRLDAEDLAAFEDIDDCEIETQRRRLRERNAIAKRNRENIACILNMTTAIPFKYYQNRFTCFHCSKDFNEHEDVRTHTLLEHPFYDLERKCPKSLKGVNMIYRTKRPAN
ncbi:hypothetical protein MSG28_014728 [Choristoneura fumiferana]|uniref:Uncharacterized protein n=1 Tax=Choristoneura fumiferana TaxID=7141 RepID=A0ACC0JSU7_CHOFU|nr:hypothetical protein MSG28_014728 [Choristoneura fumiferana]